MDRINSEVAEHPTSTSTTESVKVSRRVFLRSMLGAGAAILSRGKTEASSSARSHGMESLSHPRQLRQDTTLSTTESTAEAENPLSPTQIDYVETYGHTQAFTRDELNALNEKKYQEQVDQLPNTYYATCLVPESLYDSFRLKTTSSEQVTLQRYMLSQFEALDEIGTSFVPSRSQGALSHLAQLIVVKDDVITSGDVGLPRSKLTTPNFVVDVTQFSGSDTVMMLDPNMQYPLTLSDETIPYDFTMIRNLAVSVFHLPKDTELDLSYELDDPALSDVPRIWRLYLGSRRPDITDPLFSTPNDQSFGQYSKLLLDQRLSDGTLHSLQTLFEGNEIFPARFPDQVQFSFGNTFSGGSFTLHRVERGMQEGAHPKLMKTAETILDESGSCIINRASLLTNVDNMVAHASEGTYFVKVTMPSGKSSFRWLDIRDVASSGLPILKDGIPMLQMELTDGSITPENFNWSIKYNGHTLNDLLSDRVKELIGNSGQPAQLPEQPRDIEQIRYAQDIEEVQTFGTQSPLRANENKLLIESLNSQESHLENNTYYSTMFVIEETYEQFKKNYGEDMQIFLKRHENLLNTLLADSKVDARCSIRRLILLDNTLINNMPDPYLRGIFQIQDSDGGWSFGRYIPRESAYYDTSKNIDKGLLHEWGHAILHLADQYALDCGENTLLPEEMKKIPLVWQQYWANGRNDFNESLMAAPALNIGLYASAQLNRRSKNGDVHNKEKGMGETYGFPYEIPKRVRLYFDIEEIKGAKAEVYGSMPIQSDSNRNKRFEKLEEVVLSTSGSFNFMRDNLFPPAKNGYLSGEDSILFFKITVPSGKEFYRWMDIRDFNLPYWEGHQDEVNMYLRAATPQDTPEKFDWRISYSSPSQNSDKN